MAKAKKQRDAADKAHHGSYYYYCEAPAAAPDLANEKENESEPDAGTLENFELLKEMAESDNN